MSRRIAPSNGLLKYLRGALENQKRCYDTVASVPLNEEVVRTKDHSTTRPQPVVLKSSEFRPQRALLNRLKDLAKCKQWDEFSESLELSRKNGTELSHQGAKSLITRLVPMGQYHLALRLFNETFAKSASKHQRTVNCAIYAAFKTKNFKLCEAIYSKYADIGYTVEVHHILLKMYLQQNDLTNAREFLRQLEKNGEATETSLQIFLQGAGRLQNIAELVAEFEWWRTNKELSAQSYAVFLELLLLHDKEKFEQIKDHVYKEFAKVPEVEHVYVLNSLINKDGAQLIKHINNIGKRRWELERRPFHLAMKYFANIGDIEGLGMATGALMKAGFESDASTVNVLGYGLEKDLGHGFDLAHYLESGEGDNRTMELIARVLASKSTNPSMVYQKLGLRENGSVPEDVLQELEAIESSKDYEKGLRLLKSLSQRGVTPPIQVYHKLLRIMKGSSLTAEVLMQMPKHMVNDPSIRVLRLRMRLEETKSSSDRLLRLKEFLRLQLPDTLSIYDRSVIAAEFIRCNEYGMAVYVLDSNRENDPVTRKNHDSVTLKQIMQCHRLDGNLVLVAHIIDSLLSGAANPSIVLKPEFFRELHRCFLEALNGHDERLAMQLYSQLRQCKEYRQLMIERTEADIVRAKKYFGQIRAL